MSASTPITVVAHWHIEPSSVQKVLALTLEVQRRSLEEPGCLGYEVFRQLGDEQHLLLVERYASEAALDLHRAASHYKEIVQGQIIPLLENRHVDILQPRVA